MNVLIVGSKGFIGSHAVNFFSQKENYKVFGSDIIADATLDNYFLMDVNSSDFDVIFSKSDFDVCINCSGAASVPNSINFPLQDFTLNTYNVVKILEAIRKFCPDCKLINISSAAVYGNPLNLPVSENSETKPISPYGMHKLYAEHVLQEYHYFFGLNVCSLRIFSAYGEGLRKQLFWDIYKKTLDAKEIILFGSGQEKRDFINIKDVTQSFEIIIEKGDFNAAVYNIANGVGITICEIATEMLEQLNFNGKLIFSECQRKGDPTDWSADISKISLLGYKQQINLKLGVTNYISWVKERKLF